jgi:hypothetical protein
MSPQLFEHIPQILALTPSTSPTKQIPCALPKLEYLHLVDSKPLAHSLKKHRGILPSFPFRNSWHRHSCLCAFLVHPNLNESPAPRVFGLSQTSTPAPAATTPAIHMEYGTSAPPSTNNPALPNLEIPSRRCVLPPAPSIHHRFTPHTHLRAIISTRSVSSLTSANLLRIYQC